MNIGKHPVLQGHPLHAMSSDLPITMIPLSLLAAIQARKKRRFRPVADRMLDLTLASGGIAASTGWWDWILIPSDHPSKKVATTHGLVNSGVLALVLAARLLPKRRVAILSAASAGLMLGGWLGGDLVFHHGWRVRPAEEMEMVEEKIGDANRQVFDEVAREIDEFERTETIMLVDRSDR